MVQCNIKEKKTIIISVVQKKILICFVQMLLDELKCLLLEIHNKLSLDPYFTKVFTFNEETKTIKSFKIRLLREKLSCYIKEQ